MVHYDPERYTHIRHEAERGIRCDGKRKWAAPLIVGGCLLVSGLGRDVLLELGSLGTWKGKGKGRLPFFSCCPEELGRTQMNPTFYCPLGWLVRSMWLGGVNYLVHSPLLLALRRAYRA